MRVGAFEIDDSVHGLRNPHVISTLRPWIDAGSVGKLVLARLEDRLGARSAGSLVQPGQFFDFTRYRPVVRYRGDERTFVVPNTTVSYVRRREEPDFVFLDLLEPHSHAEDYIESILELISSLTELSPSRSLVPDLTPQLRSLRVRVRRGPSRWERRRSLMG